MATSTSKTHCVTCGKERVAYKCEGCSQTFCVNHLPDHHRELGLQLDEVEHERNLFQQTLTEQTTNPQIHSLIQQVNQWEEDSIHKIRQTAEEARHLLVKKTTEHTDKIEVKLAKLTEQLKQTRQENDFNEIDLNRFKKKLKQLEKELNKPSNIQIKYDSTPLVTKIYVGVSAPLCIPNINVSTKWTLNGTTVAGGNGQGNGLNQLSHPMGVYVDDDQTIYVADQLNHRIVEWKNNATNGQVVVGRNGRGNRSDQLNGPLNVIVDKENDCLIICDYNNRRVVRWPCGNGTSGEALILNVLCHDLAIDSGEYLYVSDVSKHEVRRWKIGDANGTVVAGGNGRGDRLDQLSAPHNIFVDQDHSIYVADRNNHRVMKWMKDAKEGTVVAGGHGQGNRLTQLYNPCEVTVDELGTVYVADCGNHRVMRWLKGATQGSVVVGGNESGRQANQLNVPVSLSFDRQNNLYVVDNNNHRVQKFNIEPNSTM